MNPWPLLLALCLTAPAPIWAEPAIEIGTPLEDTLKILGKPAGIIELRDKTLLLYPQGEVTLREDKVAEFSLMTDEEFAADQERLKREREEWLVQQENARVARIAEGEAIKKERMTNQSFAALPAKDRVNFWRSFQVRYPEVDVSEQLSLALQGYLIELDELKNQQRIAELEARVAKAEQEAATARLETEKLRKETEAQSQSYYGLRYYTDPVVHRRYYYRPPVITIQTNTTNTQTDKPVKRHKDPNQKPKTEPEESTTARVRRLLMEAAVEED
ncbi:hypothetical protein [Coraliomargarita parva]|uniref:hypothetical protein n=1 Tax=Coraliomargarita parva TaxID=3014050 RepID=UPI0022B5DED9|nr:hypothetical protein [Coraliomargarita parva]